MAFYRMVSTLKFLGVPSEGLDDHTGRVVPARAGDGFFNKVMGWRERRMGFGNNLSELVIEYRVGDSVGAEQKTISRLITYGPYLRSDKLVPCPEGLLDDVSPRVVFCLPFIDGARALEPADMGIIL